MLIFKLVGAMCILLSGAVIYIDAQRKHKIKVRQAEGFISLIGYIEYQIESHMLPIDLILKGCKSQLLINCGADVSKSFASLDELLSNTHFYIDKEMVGMLESFAYEFGTKYRDEQISSCEKCMRALTAYCEKIKEKHYKEKKVKLALCLSISFSIILLLI